MSDHPPARRRRGSDARRTAEYRRRPTGSTASSNELSPLLITDHGFIGGYEIDPKQPAMCQICGRHTSGHGA
jgi:hypothetical protein